LLARVPGIDVTAVEIDPALCALARSNAGRNGFVSRFETVQADVTAAGKVLDAAGLHRESYDHVIANPPFHAAGTVRTAASKATAHVMHKDSLHAWIGFLTAMAAPRGSITLIHRPEALGALVKLLEGRFGDVAVFPLFPRQDEAASRIILQGRKGSRAPLRLLPGLILHEADGSYSDAAEAVLRQGGALDLAG
jgi:tRNA1(Val) A37 N6-methylase TrmN6